MRIKRILFFIGSFFVNKYSGQGVGIGIVEWI